jgi:deoxyribodipyrimidine photo-lyase
MNRDVRTVDNWALLFAQNLAVKYSVPLRVVYTLPPPPPEKDEEENGGDDESAPPPDPTELPMTERHATFLLDGLQIVAKELSSCNVPFDILCPTSRDTVGSAIHSYCTTTASSHNNDALAVVTDFSPLRLPRTYTEDQAAPLLDASQIPLYQVDAHNIVPVWMASPKREVGARTLRPKINKVFGEYCTQFPEFTGNDNEGSDVGEVKNEIDWDVMRSYLRIDPSITHISSMTAGHTAAMERFHTFCTSKQHGLRNFDTLRNDPNFPEVCSNLSPWINYGQVSFQRLALDVRALKRHSNGTAAYIEEGVVRRELSDNYVYYTRDDYGKCGVFYTHIMPLVMFILLYVLVPVFSLSLACGSK